MLYEVNCENPEHRFFMLALLPSVMAQLGLDKRDGFVYITVEKPAELGTDDAIAAAHDLGMGYVVSLSADLDVKELAVSLCHELVHIKQMATGKLSGQTWCGKDHSATEYLSLPWEIQAYQMQELLYLRAFATL